MPAVVVLVAEAMVVLSPFLLTRRASARRVTTLLIPVLPLANAAVFAVYVFGEDSYRGNGISRWDAYTSPGGAAGPMFLVLIAFMSVSAVLMAVAIKQHAFGLLRGLALIAAAAALLLGLPTLIAFSAN
jgi:hypothetical protein